MKILYCTGNEGKFKEASFVFAAFNEMRTRVAASRGQTTEGTVEVIQVSLNPVPQAFPFSPHTLCLTPSFLNPKP
jgi:hypothetical protein